VRLRVSRPSAEEQLSQLVNEGYELRRSLWSDYDSRRKTNTFDRVSDLTRYLSQADEWLNRAQRVLIEIFPTALESNYFVDRAVGTKVLYENIDQDVGRLFNHTLPTCVEKLKRILEVDLSRYTDLPIQDRLYMRILTAFRK
jgi:hypothetical protein